MTISIAMATYKGAKYIEAQLNSILSQTHLPDEIIICDDNSPDDTVAIIRRIAAQSSIPIHLHVNSQNLGVIQNFAKAISLCKGDYIALSDQDDIWLPEKIAISLNAVQKAEAILPANTPVLAHTDLKLVNDDLSPLHPSFLDYTGLRPHATEPLKRIMVQNYITGCTAFFNRALAEKALPFPPETMIHDHWLALVAAASGKLISLPDATILYRQHGNNQIGVRKTPILVQLINITNFKTLHAKANQLTKLAQRLAPTSRAKLAEDTANMLHSGGFAALKYMLHHHIAPSSLIGKAYFYTQLMLMPPKRAYTRTKHSSN